MATVMKVNANISRIWRPKVANGKAPFSLHKRAVHQSQDPPVRYFLGHSDVAKVTAAPEHVPRGLFLLSPQSERYLVGVLADTAAEGLVLGLTTYLSGGHKGIIDAIKLHCGEVKSVLWGGELYLNHPQQHTGSATLQSINNTSGHLHERAKLGLPPHRFEVNNHNEHLMGQIAESGLFVVPEDVRSLPFSPEAPHLFTQTDWPHAEGINFRHGMGRRLQGCQQPVAFYSEAEDQIGSRQLEILREDVQATVAFCQVLLATDAFNPTALKILIRDLQKMLDGESFERAAYQIIRRAFECLADYFRENMITNCGNEYDLIMLSGE